MKKLFYICCLCLITQLSFAASEQLLLKYKINGITGPVANNVEKRLAIIQRFAGPELTASEIESFYAEGPEAIRQAMQPYGYFQVQVHNHLQHQRDTWIAIYDIVPGPVVKIKQVDVEISGAGKTHSVFQNFLAHFPIKSGDALNTEKYEAVKKALFNIANNEGFLAAQLTVHQIKIDLTTYTATIALHFDTGPQYYFGPIKFEQNTFDPNFLQRFVPFKTGSNYSGSALLQLQQNLANSGYFAETVVTPKKPNNNSVLVPITVTLIPRKKAQYSMGLGYGTDTGPRGSLGLDLRQLTTTGQTFKASLTASAIQNTLSARYVIPGKNPLIDQYYISAALGQESLPNDSSGTLAKLTVGYLTQLSKKWQQNLFISPQAEHYSINGGPFQESYILLPGINWSRSTYDDPIFPLQGSTININIQGTGPFISSSEFLQTELKGNYIFSLTSANRFILQGDIGYAWINDLNQLPLSLQYFAGGSQSIRGYGYESLGPGRTLAIGSIEYQRQVYNKWYATVFYDTGNATNHLICHDADDGNAQENCGLKSSPGIGVLWASPVGPLEITLAQAIDEPNKPLHVEFSMGVTL